METEIFNLDNRPDLSQELFRSVAETAWRLAELKDGSCSIVFQNEAEISALHDTYFKDPTVTDVITFNLGDETPEAEIYICLEQAIRQSGEFEVSLQEEISRLIIHGILHVAGYRDDSSHHRLEMKACEDEFLQKIKKEFPKLAG